jgi:hypothetical protein
MRTILDWQREKFNLSDELYEITADEQPEPLYKTGALVRIISYPSVDPDYEVVCRDDAKIDSFCGIKKQNLKLVSSSAQSD